MGNDVAPQLLMLDGIQEKQSTLPLAVMLTLRLLLAPFVLLGSYLA